MVTTSDLLTHPWIMSADADTNNNTSGTGIKKKKTQIKADYSTNSNNNNNMNGNNIIKVTLKELLNVSSDWKEVNKKNPSGGPSVIVGGLPMDF
jgi:hypothetical protein